MNNEKSSNKDQAKQLMQLISTLSLFARVTMNDWLPGVLADLQLTEERYMAMFELKLQPDMSLKQLAQCTMASPSNLSVMVNAMVEQGLVCRVPDPEDRRRVLLRLSDLGEKVFTEVEQLSLVKYQEFLERLDREDRQELAAVSSAMIGISEKILGKLNLKQDKR